MRVDFYLIAASDETGLLTFVAELLEQGYKQRRRYYVHTDNEKSSHALDELLWAFNAESFVPHQLWQDQPSHPSPVIIGHDLPPPRSQTFLVNLAQEIPGFLVQFRQAIDISANNESSLAHARKRFSHYKQAQHQLQYYDCRQSEPLND